MCSWMLRKRLSEVAGLFCADTAGLPSELTRILTTIEDLDRRAGGACNAISCCMHQAQESWSSQCGSYVEIKERIENNVHIFLNKPLPAARKGNDLPAEVRMHAAFVITNTCLSLLIGQVHAYHMHTCCPRGLHQDSRMGWPVHAG